MLNQIPIFNYEIESLRSNLGLMLKQDFIFEGSLIENITLGRKGIDQKDISWAIKSLGLIDHIASMPEGLDTELSPANVHLGHNVVQKIKLARAIVNRPSILLLDEPLEHLIPEETEIISKFLMAKNHNWTVIVVSDCPHLTPLADKIIHLK